MMTNENIYENLLTDDVANLLLIFAEKNKLGTIISLEKIVYGNTNTALLVARPFFKGYKFEK
jgi:hypothetical protein